MADPFRRFSERLKSNAVTDLTPDHQHGINIPQKRSKTVGDMAIQEKSFTTFLPQGHLDYKQIKSSLEISIARSYSTSSISEYLVELGLWTSSVYSIAPPTMNFTVSSPDYTGLVT
ncbi:hypothetical protein J6590_020189 [Homalodisca vitripennis]|nr:hypothetical protein J6590_020189 [Homalodisca vitripennis]